MNGKNRISDVKGSRILQFAKLLLNIPICIIEIIKIR